jgi:hypothetical protein
MLFLHGEVNQEGVLSYRITKAHFEGHSVNTAWA